MFSPGDSLSPTQNLTNSRNSMPSLDVKRCFEVMAIKHCCEVTTQHNVFKFSGNDAETPFNVCCVNIKFVLNLIAHDRIKYTQNTWNNGVLQVTKQWLLWIPFILFKYKTFVHLPYNESENKLFYLYTSFHVI